MAISNELSSEIAAAILSTRQTSSLPLEDLKLVVEQIHETLGKMADENRKPKARSAAGSVTPVSTTG